VHYVIILREEPHLEHKFGGEYRRYKTKVPRYLVAILKSGYTTTTNGSYEQLLLRPKVVGSCDECRHALRRLSEL
jgi:hypothetical protein